MTEKDAPVEKFLCRITENLMIDPIKVTSCYIQDDGKEILYTRTYERMAIFLSGNDNTDEYRIDPFTRGKILTDINNAETDKTLQTEIQKYIKANPEQKDNLIDPIDYLLEIFKNNLDGAFYQVACYLPRYLKAVLRKIKKEQLDKLLRYNENKPSLFNRISQNNMGSALYLLTKLDTKNIWPLINNINNRVTKAYLMIAIKRMQILNSEHLCSINISQEQLGAAINTIAEDGDSALIWVCKHKAKLLLPMLNCLTPKQQATAICATNKYGDNALILACEYAAEAVVPMLKCFSDNEENKQKGATAICATNQEGENALMLIVKFAPHAVSRALSCLNVNKEKLAAAICAIDDHGVSVLMYAFKNIPLMTLTMLEYLNPEQKTGMMKHTDIHENSLLHYLAKNSTSDAIKVFKQLIHKGYLSPGKILQENDEAQSPLDFAIKKNNTDMIKFMLSLLMNIYSSIEAALLKEFPYTLKYLQELKLAPQNNKQFDDDSDYDISESSWAESTTDISALLENHLMKAKRKREVSFSSEEQDEDKHEEQKQKKLQKKL